MGEEHGLIRMELVTHQYHIRLGQIVEKFGSSYIVIQFCYGIWMNVECFMLS